ncbi:MAG TPA: replication-associated recombination protein A [Candidatus Acidoferrum sp.]|nr:replication-associated recombination protein A [Candidatus Acidoferrum sp.]
MSLFSRLPEPETPAALQPLAERMRPRTLYEFVGQEKLLAPGKPLRVQIESDNLSSMVFWGPPGCGKTTLARLIARVTKSEFVPFSAVTSGIKEIKEVMTEAERKSRSGLRTILFVDEVHRFNKAQQDAFLPHVEAGHILFIGATTENPSFEVISPLLSRTKVYVLEAHSTPQIVELLQRALRDKERGLGEEKISISEDVLFRMASFANGDARTAYNTLELCVKSAQEEVASEVSSFTAEIAEGPQSSHRREDAPLKTKSRAPSEPQGKPSSSRVGQPYTDQRAQAGVPVPRVKRITVELLESLLQRKMLRYDKAGEEHYNLISALHKSVRNSDPDAALYWLARMLESGEDPLYLARRMVRMASEDIGLAEPGALAVTLAAKDAFDFLGAPEGYLALAQAAVYLSLAPKSNAVYTAYGEVVEDVQKTEADPVPLHLRNAVTGLMKNMGYGKGYKYAHDFEDKLTDMSCLPDNLSSRVYYQPTEQGFEARLRARMEEIRKIKARGATHD